MTDRSNKHPPAAGLYETLITDGLARALEQIDRSLNSQQTRLHSADAANRIALHMSVVIERALSMLPEKQRVEAGMEAARNLIRELDQAIGNISLADDMPTDGHLLRAIVRRQPDGSFAPVVAPDIPLLDTTLLTNAPGEPRVGHQVRTEIASADRIDLLMAFIRRSGISPLQQTLQRHCHEGRPLRVLTTTYTGSTERAALDLLRSLGAQVRVSYDNSSTRLHAKAWLFHRASGFSTAYIGSSNLTHSAQISGLEWNVRVSGARNPDVVDKIDAVFQSYWESGDFRPYEREEFEQLTGRDHNQGPIIYLSPADIRPEPFQERLLEQLALARQQGLQRNLLVSATGTGKTIMAALDYLQLRRDLPRARLLFVAHRQEILDQSQATFRHVLRQTSFGEQWIAGRKPRHFEHVFASVQSLAQVDLDDLPAEHFDVVIVDEFHHAAARTYDRLLQHLRPRQLLGLTATPERSDGQSVLGWFNQRIAAELRLWDAIDRHYLTPFSYFGIHDGLDLREVPWRRGRGYDTVALGKLYTATDMWARTVVNEVRARTDDVQRMQALGFCVSVDHARYMARVFNEAGIRAEAIWGETAQQHREQALLRLADGRINVVFSVDLFNEGVDIPAADTLLMLRPTDSPTLFLQQLGRGLRRARGKTTCLVLDFVGQHRREFRFDRKLRALLGGTRKDLQKQVEQGFPFLPAGCHMELDPVAAEVVLRSIRDAIPSKWPQKVAELRAMANAGHTPTLASFLEHSGLDLDDVYSGSKCWSDLCDDAGISTLAPGPDETRMRRAIGRLLHVDDRVRLDWFVSLLQQDEAPDTDAMSEMQRRLTRMLVSTLTEKAVSKSAPLQTGVARVWQHPQLRAELLALFTLLRQQPGHLQQHLPDRPEVPLQVHARYTRREIIAAFTQPDTAYVPLWQTGCLWLPEIRTDLFAFTLDKTSGAFSPTTRYRDYAVSRNLIHWESQTATSVDSDTGQRYLNHENEGSSIMLFARLRQQERAFWFLGPATFQGHQGDRPIAITWRLQHRLPGDLFTAFAAAVA